ncbi:MAG: hypothetical protein VYC19_03230 [Pseudomonadota bacterium]|jgi:hypothetical protein|nr:hypothetical protein [Pseudomonadota bacterium]
MQLSKLFSKRVLGGIAASALALIASNAAFEYALESDYSDEQKQKLKLIFQNSIDIEDITFRQSKMTDVMIEMLNADAFVLDDTMHMHTRYKDYKGDKNLVPWLFAHEHVHVWQNKLCGSNDPHLLYAVAHDYYHAHFQTPEERQDVSYRYRLTDDRDLSDYNREQQASIVADYFAIKAGGYAIYLDLNQSQIRDMHLYESVLKNFLEDPSYISNHCKNIHYFDPKAGL